jgi:hypothetical protein
VIFNGTLACQPRVFDNGDGTVTDHQTGLMWEKKTTTCAGEVTCVNVAYDYTNLNLYLLDLNGGQYIDPVSGLSPNNVSQKACLANRCDWRLPTIAELQTILLAPNPCGTSPCIDPVFGPTATAYYISSSWLASDPTYVWVVYFGDNRVLYVLYNYNRYFARAVRNDR